MIFLTVDMKHVIGKKAAFLSRLMSYPSIPLHDFVVKILNLIGSHQTRLLMRRHGMRENLSQQVPTLIWM